VDVGVKQGPVLRLTSGSLEVDYEDLCDLTRDLCLMLPFFAIFSTMVGAVEIARMLPDPAMREKVLGSARDFLLRSF